MADSDFLPPLVLTESYSDWDGFLAAVYQFYKNDFEFSRPKTFNGKPFSVKRHPEVRGMSATFWHLITERIDTVKEEERTPNIPRCERIRWPRPIIERADQGSADVRIWKQPRKQNRIAIALADFSYIVIIDERQNYVLIWTAFYAEHEHQRAKKKREYDEAIKKLAPQRDAGTPSTPGG